MFHCIGLKSRLVYPQKARVIREKLFGEKGGEVMQSDTHLGPSYKAQKDPPMALSFYEKAMPIRSSSAVKPIRNPPGSPQISVSCITSWVTQSGERIIES